MEIYYSVFFVITLAAGGGMLVKWLSETRFGTKSLESAGHRRNNMPYYFPFAVLFGWLLLTAIGSGAAESLTSKMTDWRQKFATFGVFFAIEVVVIFFIVNSAKIYFEDGLRGFGIKFKDIFRDLALAAAIFVSVWPLVIITLWAVVFIGTLIVGPEFEFEKNEGLVVLLEHKQLILRVLMVLFAAGLTPIFEELVFRGLLQTYMREGLGYGPWQSIFFASAIFAVLHPLMHLPAIFILSVAMGYAYEKSGSLLRPIFIHLLFNGTTIAFALLTT
ncbi:MAG: hypothetical protein A2Y10_15555 [Planctomycetes bacterium GWF2_41_51]|nr:MAG: hypothetical protein A2Y10_15555 [Planctomycetes bacterium GWF2_41_51]HBG27547.1 hypothetical protein [Phycisphaerales bacterium]